jgi:creatinine amidohydrolase/Fe(II)-dependent formamide hydrolase-like protein
VDYYARQASGADPFNWVKVHPLMSADIIAQYPFDHAGIGETSLMMAICPEAVELERTGENTFWYTETAKDSSAQFGMKARDLIAERLLSILRA